MGRKKTKMKKYTSSIEWCAFGNTNRTLVIRAGEKAHENFESLHNDVLEHYGIDGLPEAEYSELVDLWEKVEEDEEE